MLKKLRNMTKKKALALVVLILSTTAVLAATIPSLTALTTTATGDLLYIVDVSDTTDSANGTGKKITVANLHTNLFNTTSNDSDDITEGSTKLFLSSAQETKLDGLPSTITESFVIAASDEGTDLTTGTAKITFRMPYAFTLTDVRASVNTAPVGSTITVDINESGSTILSTKLTIDASEETSETAATAAVISDSALADDAEITIDIDQIGSSTAGKGLKVVLIGNQ